MTKIITANSRIKNWLEIALAGVLVAVLIGASVARILQTPSVMYWDQQFLRYTFNQPYPKLEQGLPQFWLAGLIQAGGALDEVTLNTALRLVAAIFYLLTAGILGWVVRGKGGILLFGLWMLLVFTSGLEFLWLSSELLAGAFLMLFLWSLVTAKPFGIQALLLVLYGLIKPDLFVTALVVGTYLAYQRGASKKERLIRLDLIVIFFILALLPGLLQRGLVYFQSDGRSLNSLGQHYAGLIYPLQVTPGLPEPWQYYGIYVAGTWGIEGNALSLIFQNPGRYLDFVFLSFSMTLQKWVQGLLIFYIPAAVLVFLRWQDRKLKTIVLLFLVNLIPIFLLAFFHIRYGTRFLPLALFTIFAGLKDVANPRLRLGINFGMVLLLFAQAILLFIPAYTSGYWTVD